VAKEGRAGGPVRPNQTDSSAHRPPLPQRAFVGAPPTSQVPTQKVGWFTIVSLTTVLQYKQYSSTVQCSTVQYSTGLLQ
jgi:hypothetical protein